MKAFELEIIACTVEDARAAAQGGATRLEVTVSLEQAGVTPPRELVESITRQVPIPVRVMLRDRPDFILGGIDELNALERTAREFASIGVEGFVTGYVKDGRLDLAALEAVIRDGGSRRITVHRAIEQTADPLETLRVLRQFPTVDCALVRVGGTVEQRIERIPDYERAAGPDTSLMLGGDLQLDQLSPLLRRTNVRYFHLGRAVRTPEIASAAVDEEKVRRAVELLNEACRTAAHS